MQYHPGKEWQCVIEYLEFFELTAALLTNHPQIKCLETRSPIPGQPPKIVYANFGKKGNKISITADNIKKPEIGQYHPNWFTTLQNRLPEISQKFHPNHNLFNWYEFRLLKIFKTLGLKCEKIKITREIKGKTESVAAYRIIDGIEDFLAKPRTAFASHDNLKTDCVTLPQLQRAAQKFGLAPARLKIINNFIIDSAGNRHTGTFSPITGDITLANSSLSLLAHEGIHYMKTQGIIPRREYQALIKAGQELVAKDPLLQKYVEQVDSTGQPLYPPGDIRNNEFAALFAESYFNNDKIARTGLIDAKIPYFKKIIEYIKNVLDIIKSTLGNDIALARICLRKISQNYTADFIQEKSSQSFLTTENPGAQRKFLPDLSRG